MQAAETVVFAAVGRQPLREQVEQDAKEADKMHAEAKDYIAKDDM